MIASPTVVWFRQDLRLQDNPALTAAATGQVVPVYIWAPQEEGDWPPGGASRWWLHQSLTRLDQALRQRNSRLIVRRDSAVSALLSVVRATGARRVVWNRRWEPHARAVEAEVRRALAAEGIETDDYESALLVDPDNLSTRSGGYYQVFTPFWKALQQLSEPGSPLPVPQLVPLSGGWPPSLTIADLGLLPTPDWAQGLRDTWVPGEDGAHRVLEEFLGHAVGRYHATRDCPEPAGVSHLSPYLHHGEMGPRQVWHAVRAANAERGANLETLDPDGFLRQLAWREFAHHLLAHLPETIAHPLRPEFSRFPWRDDRSDLRRWQRGHTGYPLVDAGMHQLWQTGWMHNRVRMVTASFLVKHLLLSWQHGARWFWDTLVDADLANNTLGWQWTAGCGADAAPYFRIFNPVAQGERFDPDGAYVRRWVPALAGAPARWIHQPWIATPAEQDAAGLSAHPRYPQRLVEHHFARTRALAALQHTRTTPAADSR